MRTMIQISIAGLFALCLFGSSALADSGSGNTLALVPAGGPALDRDARSRTIGQRSERSIRQAQSQYTIDLVSDGNVTAIDFTIKVSDRGGAPMQNLDSSNCVSGLPSTHQGQCRFHPDRGELKVVVFSLSNAPLPTGTLGSISFQGMGTAKLDGQSVTLSNAEGRRLEVEVF